MIDRAGWARRWWFPLALCAVVAANGFTASRHAAGLRATGKYRLAVRQDDSLTAAVPAAGGFAAMTRQLLATQAALGGSVLRVPSRLDIRAGPLRIFARIALEEHEHPALSPVRGRELAREAVEPPLRFEGQRAHLTDGVQPPWTAPLYLLQVRDTRDLYVVTQERLATLGLEGS